MDALAEVILFLELLLVARIVRLHLPFLPNPQRMGRMHVRRVQVLAEPLAGHCRIPVMAVDELVLETVFTDEAHGVFMPLFQLLVEVFLGEESLSAARHPNDADPLGHRFQLGLVLKLPRPDVHLIAELGEFLGEFEDIDCLPLRCPPRPTAGGPPRTRASKPSRSGAGCCWH